MAKVPLPVGASFEGRVLDFFQRRRRHLLIGEISLETCIRLETVEYHLEDLVHRGGLRHMTAEEKKLVGLHKAVVAYILIDPTRFTILSQPL